MVNTLWRSMRTLVEVMMRVWPINWLLTVLWRILPFPRGTRSRIMRAVNDRFLVGVMVIIQDEHGRILLVRNTYDPRYPWSLPGGWMGKNEQPDECIKRELWEETGFQIDVDRILTTRTHERLPSVDIVFRGHISGGTFRRSAEVVLAEFFPLDDLPDGFTPLHARLLSSLEITAVESDSKDVDLTAR
jgi:8-oxo-dGTP diphosphatase